AVLVPTISQDSAAPAAPIIISPSTSVVTSLTSFTILGTAEANALVRVWIDSNNNGIKDPGETTVAGSQQLTGGATTLPIPVPLTAGAVNHFLVTATDIAGNESIVAAVLPITQDSTTPPPPTVSQPADTVSVNAGTYTITGSAAAN